MALSSPQVHNLLFVCMGNICRSPLAANVFRHKIKQRGVADRFDIDSAGTGAWHVGEPPDPRVLQNAARHGVPMTGLARQVKREDFDRFDLLLCMDQANHDHLLRMGAPKNKTRLLLEFNPVSSVREVPDPYYGGDDGFETVYRLVEAACDALLVELLNDRS